MVMYQNDHPLHWTPVYVGGRVRIFFFSSVDTLQYFYFQQGSGLGPEKHGQLMTSVTTPILDRRNHSVSYFTFKQQGQI